MFIKWTDEINSFDKYNFIHEEKQLCYSRKTKNFSTNLLVGLFGNKIEKLFIYYYVQKKMVISKSSNLDQFIKKEFIKKPINLH